MNTAVAVRRFVFLFIFLGILIHTLKTFQYISASSSLPSYQSDNHKRVRYWRVCKYLCLLFTNSTGCHGVSLSRNYMLSFSSQWVCEFVYSEVYFFVFEVLFLFELVFLLSDCFNYYFPSGFCKALC